jgi:hypothetical protein
LLCGDGNETFWQQHTAIEAYKRIKLGTHMRRAKKKIHFRPSGLSNIYESKGQASPTGLIFLWVSVFFPFGLADNLNLWLSVASKLTVYGRYVDENPSRFGTMPSFTVCYLMGRTITSILRPVTRDRKPTIKPISIN